MQQKPVCVLLVQYFCFPSYRLVGDSIRGELDMSISSGLHTRRMIHNQLRNTSKGTMSRRMKTVLRQMRRVHRWYRLSTIEVLTIVIDDDINKLLRPRTVWGKFKAIFRRGCILGGVNSVKPSTVFPKICGKLENYKRSYAFWPTTQGARPLFKSMFDLLCEYTWDLYLDMLASCNGKVKQSSWFWKCNSPASQYRSHLLYMLCASTGARSMQWTESSAQDRKRMIAPMSTRNGEKWLIGNCTLGLSPTQYPIVYRVPPSRVHGSAMGPVHEAMQH